MKRVADKSPAAVLEGVLFACVLTGLVIGGIAVLVTLRAAGWGVCR